MNPYIPATTTSNFVDNQQPSIQAASLKDCRISFLWQRYVVDEKSIRKWIDSSIRDTIIVKPITKKNDLGCIEEALDKSEIRRLASHILYPLSLDDQNIILNSIFSTQANILRFSFKDSQHKIQKLKVVMRGRTDLLRPHYISCSFWHLSQTSNNIYKVEELDATSDEEPNPFLKETPVVRSENIAAVTMDEHKNKKPRFFR